ncbi:MAG TPA: hypothetical protein VN934_03585 [Candidatus Tumulicola sp.]|nr:hypothetical protein [Candidatus Tumulicola sp.]
MLQYVERLGGPVVFGVLSHEFDALGHIGEAVQAAVNECLLKVKNSAWRFRTADEASAARKARLLAAERRRHDYVDPETVGLMRPNNDGNRDPRRKSGVVMPYPGKNDYILGRLCQRDLAVHPLSRLPRHEHAVNGGADEITPPICYNGVTG